MKYIKDLREGSRISGIYFCKTKTAAVTKNGRNYDNVVLQDKTGVIDCKVWDPHSSGIDDYDSLDYVDVMGDVTMFNGSLQASLKRIRRAHESEYDPADYMPCSRYSRNQMYEALLSYADQVENTWLKQLLDRFFRNPATEEAMKESSAAKSVHHGFIGGLLEHTVSVTRLCIVYTKVYTFLNKDLLITSSLLHDIGKLRELSPFPQNDYTDEGQLLGHIMIGAEMIHDQIREIEGFPTVLENELKHCILAHHGELEYGSPKKPALAEAIALNMADNTDAKLENIRELMENSTAPGWMGYQKLLESNFRKTTDFSGED